MTRWNLFLATCCSALVLIACGSKSRSDPDSGASGADGEVLTCGNGVLDPGETCDTAIASGPKACPAACPATEACLVGTLDGTGCDLTCTYAKVTTCGGGDGCCPAACTHATDGDCPAEELCGNGVLDAGETCDTAIATGPGACPASCDSSDPCVEAELFGAGCSARCLETTITKTVSGDGCCPAGATYAQDTDCLAGYHDPCTTDADCLSGLCLVYPYCSGASCTCTKTCSLSAALTDCGGMGYFCDEILTGAPSGTGACLFFVDTGVDNDNKTVGLHLPVPGSIDLAGDVDLFVANLQPGEFSVTVTPSDANSNLDARIDLYALGKLVGSVNQAGTGAVEQAILTVGSPGLNFLAVGTANNLTGNYLVKIVPK